MNLLKRLFITILIVLALTYFIEGVIITSTSPLEVLKVSLIVSVVLGLLNTFLKPVLVFFTLPITFFTLGLFLLVINAGMVLLCDKLVDGFDVDGFLTAMLFSVLMSISQWVLYKFIKD